MEIVSEVRRGRTGAVVLSDDIAAWVDKGEIAYGYLNPGGWFSKLIVVLTTNQVPDLEVIQHLAASEEIDVVVAPTGRSLFATSVAWTPRMLESWARPIAMFLASQGVELIRCFGAHLNGAIGLAGQELGIPLVVSVHGSYRHDAVIDAGSAKGLVGHVAISRLRRRVLRQADLVMPVYTDLVSELAQLGAKRISVVHNPIASSPNPKSTYGRSGRLRVVSLGRQFSLKDPRPLAEAALQSDSVELTLIGNGPLHADLRAMAARCPRIRLIPSMRNDLLIESLSSYDVAAFPLHVKGVPKTMIECAMAGLPIVVNADPLSTSSEVDPPTLRLIEGSTPEHFVAALESLANNEAERSRLGKAGRAWAMSGWSESTVNRQLAKVYESLTGSFST